MSAAEIKSPTGLDLNPRPPATVRLSKRAGILSILLIGGVMAMVGLGIYLRAQRQAHQALGPADDRNIVAATDAGRQIASEVPAKSLGAPDPPALGKEGLQAPAEPKGLSQVNPATSRTVRVHSVSHQSMPQPGYRETTAEEKRLQLEYQREQEAIAAPTRISLPETNRAVPSTQPAGRDLSQLAALLLGLERTGMPAQSPVSHLSESAEKKASSREETLLPDVQPALPSTRTPASGKFEIKSGWVIPAILEQDINSDLPGEIRALVRENVYDTASGRWLLIPQGSRLVGIYDSHVAYGQEAVQVFWNRIIFPDDSSIDLGGMVGQDASGASGFRDDVDHHYKRLLGFGLLTSVFSSAFQLSQSRRGSTLDYPGPAETAGSAVGQQISQLGIDVTRRNLNVQPTIKVRAGYRFNVRVNRDLVFDQPYR
jgi:type IV secretion system protein VirB10